MNSKFLLICLLPACFTYGQNNVLPFITTRSHSSDMPRTLVGTIDFLLYDKQNKDRNWHASLSATPVYQRSFRSDRISQCLFGNDLISADDCPRLVISGSQIKNRGHQDWLADYFGLPPDFKSNVEFNPSIKDFIIDTQFIAQWNRFSLLVSLPFVHQRRSLDIRETIIAPGVLGYTPGYFSPAAVDRTNLLPNFSTYISGCGLPQLEDVTFEPLSFGKMHCKQVTDNALSNILFILLAEIVNNECWKLFVNVRGATANGTRPNAEFLFEPIVGNGRHGQLGGGLLFAYTFWNNSCEQTIDWITSLQVDHLFEADQYRFFDVWNNCKSRGNSRYMLAQKITPPVENDLQGTSGTPDAQFKNVLTPLVNLTTLCVKSNYSIQAELTSFLHYQHCNWDFDIGYNLWAISCERICKDKSCDLAINQGWALKGDTYLFGFDDQNNFESVALSGTQSNATINAGNNFPGSAPFVTIPNTTTITFSDQNPGIDNPEQANGTTNANPTHPLVNQPDSMRDIQTSVQPVLLSDDLIDTCFAQSRGLSHSIFVHLNYRWTNHCVVPYLGIGGRIEIVPKVGDLTCTSCPNCAITLVEVWLKGGIDFD